MRWSVNAKTGKQLVLVLLAVLVAVDAFLWNEARKEIFFLCGNFTPGVSEESVLSQLDTGSFLSYRAETLPTGNRIIVDSHYNLKTSQCTIDLDADGRVIRAVVEQGW